MGYLYFNSKTRVEIDANVQSYHEASNPSFYRVRSAKPLFTRMYEDWQLDIRKSKVNKVVLHHDGIPVHGTAYGVQRACSVGGSGFIVRRSTEEGRRLSGHVGSEYVGVCGGPVAHHDRDVVFEFNGVRPRHSRPPESAVTA